MRQPNEAGPGGPLLILASRLLLTRRFGFQGWQAVNEALGQLAQSLRHLSAHLIYVDDAHCLARFGVRPVSPRDPDLIRRQIGQLERSLGGRPATLWLIGDDVTLPLFRVTNPADDPDGDILSDAPYASADGDPLVASRPVARLPHPGGGVDGLLALIYRAVSARPVWTEAETPLGVGYTASIWRDASRAVLSALPAVGPLRMSPPWELDDYPYLRRQQAPVRYFNLHGTPDGTAWHGQLDPALPADFDDFPCALRQLDVTPEEARGAVVVTESCYGVTFHPSSIAMRFLRLGAGGFLGSTAMSYGALTSPISGADLLVREFLRLAASGVPLGEALLLARRAFARTMMEAQGFLDAEDQKTLLSFLLLGDPTLRLAGTGIDSAAAPIETRAVLEQPLDIVRAHALPAANDAPFEMGLLREIETRAEDHLLAAARSLGCRQGTCRMILASTDNRPDSDPHRVVSFSRHLPNGGQQVVRFTIREGRITKTVVSH
ncbi:MAG: C25 family cysteine peptidase [Anaerolineae bacterium]